MSDRRGLLYGVLAYALWGIAPLYWRLLAGTSPVEILAHRAVWGLLAFVVIAAVAGKLPAVGAGFRDRRIVSRMALSGALLAVNWGFFVWAIASHHLLDASLGYFVNPLVSVALGTLVLGERLRRLQWLAIALAATGVAILTVAAGHVPWIALVLAATFALYGLVRKTAPVESLVGSTIETAMMTPFAIAYLAVRGTHFPPLLLSTGVVTAVPLLLFTSAARRLPLSTVGFLQYLAPTGQFLLAVLAFGESISRVRLGAFALIWIALAVFSQDLRSSRARSSS